MLEISDGDLFDVQLEGSFGPLRSPTLSSRAQGKFLSPNLIKNRGLGATSHAKLPEIASDSSSTVLISLGLVCSSLKTRFQQQLGRLMLSSLIREDFPLN